MYSRSRKLRTETAERQVSPREVRCCTCGAICREEGRFVRSAQQVRLSRGRALSFISNTSGGHPPYGPMPVIPPYQVER
jgi:hypothetical protein